MSRHRREDGQTAVEYAGILAVVALVFVALATLGLGGRVSGTVKDAACVITGCGGGTADANPTSAQNGGPPPLSDTTTSLPSDLNDVDGDGIPNDVERERGLDPKTFDSDGDGFGDGEEAQRGTDPRTADTDGDGVTDSEETAIGGHQPLSPKTSPFDADTDDDGLTDGEELALGTNPGARESDPYGGALGDGLTDAQEVELGTDPNSEDTDGDGTDDGTEVKNGTNPLKDERGDVDKVASAVGDAVLDDPTLLIPVGGLAKGAVRGAAGAGRALIEGGGRELIAGARTAEEAGAIRRGIVRKIRGERKPDVPAPKPKLDPSKRNPTKTERTSPAKPPDAPPARPDPDKPLAIGRVDDLSPDKLRDGEQTLLPNLPWYKGDAAASLRQNMGQLRDYARSAGYPPVRDASPGFKLDPNNVAGRGGAYLQAERNQLVQLGYRREGEYWVHRGRAP